MYCGYRQQPPLDQRQPPGQPLGVGDVQAGRVVRQRTERERRIPVRAQRCVAVVPNPPGPAQHSEVEVEQAARVATGKQDGEQRDHGQHGERDPEERQDHECGIRSSHFTSHSQRLSCRSGCPSTLTKRIDAQADTRPASIHSQNAPICCRPAPHQGIPRNLAPSEARGAAASAAQVWVAGSGATKREGRSTSVSRVSPNSARARRSKRPKVLILSMSMSWPTRTRYGITNRRRRRTSHGAVLGGCGVFEATGTRGCTDARGHTYS